MAWAYVQAEIRWNNEITTLRNDTQTMAALLGRAVMPRHLTTRQEVIIAKSLRGFELDSRQSLFGWLFFQGQWRAANFFFLEVEGYLDVIGDFDEWNAFVHAVILAIELHGAVDFA
jgi:hypothetical protein